MSQPLKEKLGFGTERSLSAKRGRKSMEAHAPRTVESLVRNSGVSEIAQGMKGNHVSKHAFLGGFGFDGAGPADDTEISRDGNAGPGVRLFLCTVGGLASYSLLYAVGVGAFTAGTTLAFVGIPVVALAGLAGSVYFGVKALGQIF